APPINGDGWHIWHLQAFLSHFLFTRYLSPTTKKHAKKKDLFSNLSNLSVNDHLMFERFVVASGEDIGAVKNESVDVVCTLVLCSAHRILRPYASINTMGPRSHHTAQEGDAFCLLEMDFLDGCEVVRATWKDLEATGFSELQLRHHSTS
uniref:Uncharacterized protein n=1 Tax=Oncorhynchus kisutch TaxID=8019 RepID=A0A8C7HS30_ONCKI